MPPRKGWTGGQFSVFRVALAAWLLAGCSGLLAAGLGGWTPWCGLPLCLLLAAGWQTRCVAIAGLGLAAWLRNIDAIAWQPGLLALAWLLALCAIAPAAPYGSWAAAGRSDPAGGWRLPALTPQASLVVLLAAIVWMGRHLAMGSLTAVPWGWIPGLMLLGAMAIDPAWFWPPRDGPPATLFYDGHCGLCHRAVRFVLAEDTTGELFQFSPLHGETFNASVSATQRDSLPDSMVAQTRSGVLLTRSAAALYILDRLGGYWRPLGRLARLVPAALRDGVYDFIARIRRRLFAPPPDACPVLPPALRARFRM